MKKTIQLENMLVTNKKQKKFYESRVDLTLKTKGNLLTQMWRRARRKQQKFRKAIKLDEYVYDKHNYWLKDINDKRVLDLGCYNGNTLSLSIAKKSKAYLGIDLSEVAIEDLNNKLKANNINGANALAIDFLSDDFQFKNKGKFDVIYAHAVAHHFKFFEIFMEKCYNCLKDGGIMITYDPLQTYIPMYLLRQLYRPFQSDKDWEYPFKKENFNIIKKHFQVIEVLGVMGKVKFALPVYFLNSKAGIKIGMKLFEKDKSCATKEGRELNNCLQVSLLLKKLPTT